jgi:hypothetical protein
MTKLTDVVPPGTNLLGEKVLAIDGGATTITLAVPGAALLPPLAEPTVTELF